MVIAFANHKGGTGKTTSIVNIACVLHNSGYSVLLIDADPQGNLSYSFNISNKKSALTEVLLNETKLENLAIEIKNDLYLLSNNISAYEHEKKIDSLVNPEFQLKKILKNYINDVDFILIDCPPSYSIFTKNALNVADYVLIPMQLDVLSIKGLEQMTEIISQTNVSSNPNIKIIGVLGVNVNESRKLTNEVLNYIRENFNIPIFNNYIRSSVKVAEAPSFGKSVVDYAPYCSSSRDYNSVTNELIKILSNPIKN